MMVTRLYVRKIMKQKKMTKKDKHALCGIPHRGAKRVSKIQRERHMKRIRAKYPYLYNTILFENHLVKIKLPNMLLKHTTFKPCQLIRHFKPCEMRRAAKRLLKVKEKFNF